MAGKLGYIGVAVSPLASFAASYIQQLITKLSIAGLKHANGIAKDVLKSESQLFYLRTNSDEIRNARIVVFSDAGFPHKGVSRRTAQEGCIVGVAFGLKKGVPYHVIVWVSRKQRRVSTSSIHAECIGAVTSQGFAIHAQVVWKNVTGVGLPITLVIDSLGLHKTLSTQATPTDMSIATEVHALRMDYESGTVDYISWIEGKKSPADPLTKPLAGDTTGILEDMLSTGRLPCYVDVLRNYGTALQEEY